jgi:hypothetical protein
VAGSHTQRRLKRRLIFFYRFGDKKDINFLQIWKRHLVFLQIWRQRLDRKVLSFIRSRYHSLRIRQWINYCYEMSQQKQVWGRQPAVDTIKLFWKHLKPGLPDGIFAYQYTQFGCISEGLGMKKCWCTLRPLGMYILWPLGTVCAHLVYFVPFWYVAPRKIWQPCSEHTM